MTERPILFSSPMVRAILAGTKTQTRRIVKLPNEPTIRGGWNPTTIGGPGVYDSDGNPASERVAIGNDTTGKLIACPYGDPGDRLWVRETHARFSVGEGMDHPVPECVAYRATCDDDGGFDYVNTRGEIMGLKITKWTPSIFMPRWASRITLEVTGVRAERLQAITGRDVLAEGVDNGKSNATHGERWENMQRLAFEDLWREINGAESWASNPWVWVVEFRRMEDR